MLRALQSGEVQQVGGRAEIVDVRLIAATNRDLAADVKAGASARTSSIASTSCPIRVPPLRERPEDVEPLVRTFVRQYAERYGMGGVEVEPALVEALRAHSWPGNVRELENTVARLLALAPDERITLALWRSLVARARRRRRRPTTAAGDPGPGPPAARRASRRSSGRSSPRRSRRAGHNQSETARRLGVSRPALIEKLHKYGLIGR